MSLGDWQCRSINEHWDMYYLNEMWVLEHLGCGGTIAYDFKKHECNSCGEKGPEVAHSEESNT